MTVTMPQRGTRDYEMWLAGIRYADDAAYEGMTRKSRELFDCVQIMAQRGDHPDDIAWFVALVFTCEWSLRHRLRLIWQIYRVGRRRRQWKVYLEPRDWWVGYYRGDDHHYVCVLPCVVLRWNRRRR